MTITIKNREYALEATGLKHVPYKITAGRQVLSGIRSQISADVILVLNSRNEQISAFSETTKRELTRIK